MQHVSFIFYVVLEDYDLQYVPLEGWSKLGLKRFCRSCVSRL